MGNLLSSKQETSLTLYGKASEMMLPPGPPNYDLYSMRLSNRLVRQLETPFVQEPKVTPEETVSSDLKPENNSNQSAIDKADIEREINRRVQLKLKDEIKKFRAQFRRTSEGYTSGTLIRQATDDIDTHHRSYAPTLKDPNCQNAESEVIECYRKNSQATLNCHEQVLKLQEMARQTSLNFYVQ